MSNYKVVLLRRWFGEQIEQPLAELDHFPDAPELLQLARDHHLGELATLHVAPAKGKGPRQEFRVRDLMRQAM